jgi:hypothetical protein
MRQRPSGPVRTALTAPVAVERGGDCGTWNGGSRGIEAETLDLGLGEGGEGSTNAVRQGTGEFTIPEKPIGKSEGPTSHRRPDCGRDGDQQTEVQIRTSE